VGDIFLGIVDIEEVLGAASVVGPEHPKKAGWNNVTKVGVCVEHSEATFGKVV
jgi:hypothetical protein